jgi:hypothetical protein
MKILPDRVVLTILRDNDLWAVEHDGQMFGHSTEKEVARAAANKHARQMQDDGRPCQVRVAGETGFFVS